MDRNARKRWSDDDYAMLIDYAKQGEPWEWIAAQLERTPAACRTMWRRLKAERQRTEDLEALDLLMNGTVWGVW